MGHSRFQRYGFAVENLFEREGVLGKGIEVTVMGVHLADFRGEDCDGGALLGQGSHETFGVEPAGDQNGDGFFFLGHFF